MPKGTTAMKPRMFNLSTPRANVPDDIVRYDDDGTPCFMCGVRAGVPCRHRGAAA